MVTNRAVQDVFRGDIIRVNDTYFEKKYYKVASDMSSNNGNFKAVDMFNGVAWFNTTTNNITIIKSRKGAEQ